MAIVRRKCFISYHHADQDEVNEFVQDFDHQGDVLIARGLGQEMSQDIIDSTDTDYVMRRIRELYLSDSTVTLVMLGKCTWARRYVDWELQASLRHGEKTTPNGLLGIKLPSYPSNDGSYPKRLNDNLLSEADKAAGRDCFARVMGYPQTEDGLFDAIDAAYQRRTSAAKWIRNSVERFSNNRQC
ncbi:MAG: hypothetical protein FVQ81_11520 [Candidatus Glassbacteria bacterium]|nr:hypothetical protein [Candidatus Glassbacteria bacterium]